MRCRLTIFLFNPDTGENGDKVYEIDIEEGMTVLRALFLLNERFPDAPAFRRYQCNRGQCYSCLMTINGKPKRACTTPVEPALTLGPLQGFPVIRDLIVDFGRKKKQWGVMTREYRGTLVQRSPFASPPKTVDRNINYALVYDPKECTLCQLCVDACPVNALATLEDSRGDKLVTGQACLRMDEGGVCLSGACPQCALSPCVRACPSGAIVKSGRGIVSINEENCNGCGICLIACPGEEIYLDMGRGVSVKCDLCGGDPQCVKGCPTGALKLRC